MHGHITWNLRRENSDIRTSTPLVQRLLCEPPKKSHDCMLSCPQETRKQQTINTPSFGLSHLTHIQVGSSPQKPTTTKLPPHHLHNSSSSTLPQPYQNMLLQQAVSYQAFREITNFILSNGDNWDEFCTKTAHTTRKAKKTPNPAETQSDHKISKNEGLLTFEPLLQENPHHFVLFPIHHANISRMYKKAEASFWTTEEIDLSADLTDWVRLCSCIHCCL